mmetsp:Transcript_23084/g.36118  ORF Transcript_23084/g.36118 Transcript_23084/m.36118 type:complete len:251 (-) Transcript_23084:106-858(-)
MHHPRRRPATATGHEESDEKRDKIHRMAFVPFVETEQESADDLQVTTPPKKVCGEQSRSPGRPRTPQSPTSPGSPKSGTEARKKAGCPMCDKAVNGKCHRCIPVYKHGEVHESSEDLDRVYDVALRRATKVREAIMQKSPSEMYWFVHDGVQCRKGTCVSVLMEDDQWHQGTLDAYNPKLDKIRVQMQDSTRGMIHVPRKLVQLRVHDRPTESRQSQGRPSLHTKRLPPDGAECGESAVVRIPTGFPNGM